MRLLAEIARKENIPVIITNQVYSEFLSDEELKAGKEKSVSMVGGDILKYWSKCLIELKNKNEAHRAEAALKHEKFIVGDIKESCFSAVIPVRGWNQWV